MKEKTIEKRIKEYLKTIDDLFYWKVFSGMYCTAGIPDIVICYKGQFIALEVKAPDGKPTALQIETIKKIREAGGVAEVVRSVEEVREIITKFTK